MRCEWLHHLGWRPGHACPLKFCALYIDSAHNVKPEVVVSQSSVWSNSTIHSNFNKVINEAAHLCKCTSPL